MPPSLLQNLSYTTLLIPAGSTRGLSRNGVKNYSKGSCVTILE